MLAAVDKFDDTSSYYLVEKGDVQYLVNVTDEFITSTRMAVRVSEKTFDVGKNRFRRAEYTINNPAE